LPYNKSILTRIIAPQLHQENILVVTHSSSKALSSHITNTGNSQGNASGIFNFIDKIFGEKRLKKIKINSVEALKMLQSKFVKEVNEIYGVLGNFREGVHSYETYTS
jgi:hypothetical protein